LFKAGFVKEGGAFGEGAFVSGTESWFLAYRANNFLVADTNIVQLLIYSDQVLRPRITMGTPWSICYVCWSGAWFMLENVAFQAFVGGTSQYCSFAHQARNMILLVIVVFQLLTQDQVMPYTVIFFVLHLSLLLLIFFQLLRE
jgi:hypothetical protein